MGADKESGSDEKLGRTESSKSANIMSVAADTKYPILTQPTSISASKSEIIQNEQMASLYSSSVDTVFDNLRNVNSLFFKSTDRVDTARCQLNIEDENGRNLYSVKIGFFNPEDKPFDPNTYTDVGITGRRITDFNDAMGAMQVAESYRTVFYSITDTATAQVVMQVREEKGNMVVRLRDRMLGQVHEDSWYKTPNFTAISGFSGTSNFIIASSKGCFTLNCCAWPSQGDFRISSTGIEVGRINWSPSFDNTKECCLNFTQSLDGNSKGLLLAAGVMVYVAHFGHAACHGGSTGQRGACWCCQIL